MHPFSFVPSPDKFQTPSGWVLKPGKEKAHKHKTNFSGDCPGPPGGGSPDRVARGLPTSGLGSKVYVLCAEVKEHKHFRPGTRPGGSVTGVTEKLFMYQMFMCLFRPLSNKRQNRDVHKISEEFQQPTGLGESTAVHLQFVRQYAPPICIVVPSWLLSFEEREMQQ